MRGLAFDISHLLAGSLVLVSFLELYQDRLYALLNMFALHALVLALSVAWQAYVQNAPHLYLTAMLHDNLLHHGQSQPGSLRFCRKKRPEELRRHVRRNPRAVIRHSNPLDTRLFAVNNFAANSDAPSAFSQRARLRRVLGDPVEAVRAWTRLRLVERPAVGVDVPVHGDRAEED